MKYIIHTSTIKYTAIAGSLAYADNVQNYRLSVHVVKYWLAFTVTLFACIKWHEPLLLLSVSWEMAVITGNITLLAKVKKLIHVQRTKVLFAATSDPLASHPTKDGRTTDSCFTHIGTHQCGIRMVVG